MNVKDKQALQGFLDKLKLIRECGTVNEKESLEAQRVRIARAKKDYRYFVATYFPHYATSDCADFHVEEANRVLKHNRCRLVEEWARGLAKSTHFTIFIPMWLMLHDELKLMLLVGKNLDSAKTLLSDLQAELAVNPQYIHDFGEQFSHGSWEEGRFTTRNGIAFQALGRGQSPRGIRNRQYRPDYIVMDDCDDDELSRNATRVQQTVEWVLKALLKTMDIGRARFVIVNNRIAQDTILGTLATNKAFHHRRVNGLDKHGKPSWYQKYTVAFYDEERALDEYAFLTEHMNDPMARGKHFLPERIQWVKVPRIDHYRALVGHWDVAYSDSATADFNAVKLWGIKDNKFYHHRAFMAHCKMRTAIEWIYKFNAQLPAGVNMFWQYESQFWNDALQADIDAVAEQYGGKQILMRAERPKLNKLDRIMRTLLPYHQQGSLYHNEAEKGNYDMTTGLTQLYAIEASYKGKDDGPDADEAAIKFLEGYLETKSTGREPEMGGWEKSSRFL